MADSPVIQIKCGKVRGFVSKADDSSAVPVNNFLSIPFGKPPTGKRRFMPPQKCDPWEGVKDATKTLVCPMQNNGVSEIYEEYMPIKNTLNHSFQDQTEDCLQLSVFTPSDKSTDKLPVLMWICGGSFLRGYSGRYDGTALSGMNNFVVVSPNFRVNALGFLSLGPDSICPGNNALRDIVLALEWVKENAECFGGDPQNVTIFGESAGSVLVHLLTLTSKARGLFHKAIACSGSCLSPAFVEDLSAVRQKFLQRLEITETEPEQIMKKLQELPVEDILKAQVDFRDPYVFYPTVDKYFFSNVPSKITPHELHDIPYLTGIGDSEGGCIMSLFSPTNFLNGCTKEEVTTPLKGFLQVHYGLKDSTPVVNALLALYDSVAADDDKYRFSKIYASVFANYVFVVPTVMGVLMRAKIVKSPTYLYLLTKQIEMNHSETNGPGVRNKLDFVNSDHGDICNLLWGVPFIKGKLPGGAWYTEDEIKLSRTIMTYFCNFARTGIQPYHDETDLLLLHSNPNQGETVEAEWPTYDPVTRRHIVLNDDVIVDENLGSSSVKFFTENLPQLIAKGHT